MAIDAASGMYYEVYGSGIPLFLAPYFATCQAPCLQGYVDALSDRYRVLVIDFPGEGGSAAIVPTDFTAARICKVMLSVADAAGFDRFVWCGYSWGAVVGLQIASGFDRLAALVCGGWPPLGGEYSKMLRGARALVREPPSEGPYAGFDAAPFATYYESIQSWPEAEAMSKISCPRLVLFGSEDATSIGVETVQIASTIRERADDLRRLGWRVSEIAGRDHTLFADPAVVVPVIREFLDAAVGPEQS